METIFISKCHGVEVKNYDEGIVLDVCPKCHKECDLKEVCANCFGTGFTPEDEDDGEGHTMIGVGRVKCPFCTIRNEDLI